MRLEQLAVDGGSGGVGCPSVHLDHDSGNLVVQGHGIDMAHLPTPLPGEQAVSIHPDIVRDAAKRLGWL